MDNHYDILEHLAGIVGPSGHEQDVQEYFAKIMKPFTNKPWTDAVGNCYAEIEGNPNAPKIMINAHADSIGFMVKYIDDLGFLFTDDLCFETFDHRMLPGTDVQVLGRKHGKLIAGQFIPTIPLHKLGGDEMEVSDVRHDLAIDIGAKSDTQAKRHVSVGDYVVLDSRLKRSGVGDRVVGANLDDRAGLYCLYLIARELSKSKSKSLGTVVLVSTVCEEVDPRMAATAAYNVKPDMVVTIDVTPATDQIVSDSEDEIAKQYGKIELDKGAVLTRGLGVNDRLFLTLERLCGKTIPYQVEMGQFETENVHIQRERGGIPAALVSIPVRNTHTRVETMSLKDVANTVTLCVKLCKGLAQKK
jgi:putative aminopeptidase FrvX